MSLPVIDLGQLLGIPPMPADSSREEVRNAIRDANQRRGAEAQERRATQAVNAADNESALADADSKKRPAGGTHEEEDDAKQPAVSSKNAKMTPQSYKGKRAAKKFASPRGFSVFYGTVAEDDRYNSDEECRVWCVNYDDDDEEEYNEKELAELFELYEMEKDGDRKK